jgi:hypothetical protein
MTTIHPWLEKYPINPDSKYLIIGTHPPMPYCGKLKYYYGNMNEFWRFLQEVYSKEKIYNNGCPNEVDIINFFYKYSISITDMVEETDGKPFSVDSDMSVTKLNSKLKEWLNKSQVKTIYLTSAGGSNSALSLFKKWIKKNYKGTSTIKDHKLWIEKGLVIKLEGREYLLEILYSPSPSGRRGIQRSEPFINWSKTFNNKSADDFRIHWYKSKLPVQINDSTSK